MSGVAGLGAVAAGVVVAPRGRGWCSGRGRRSPCRAPRSAWRSIGLGAGARGSRSPSLALAAIGAAGLVFQTTTQSLMLTLSDVDYHGRMQSMVVLGFSGFGLAALPARPARRRRHAGAHARR